METSGFYKKDSNQIDFAPNGVMSSEYELTRELSGTYTYPVYGWYWFDSFDDSIKFFASELIQTNSITMRQARLQLNNLGVLDLINNAVSTMGTAAQIEWEYASTVEKDNPLVLAMQQMLGWTQDELDSYFLNASKL